MAAPGTRPPEADPEPRAGAPKATRILMPLAARPGLWWTALVQVVRLAPPGWWRRWPPVPRPDPAFLRFRIQTMWGDPDHEVGSGDLLTYLRWCRGFQHALR